MSNSLQIPFLDTNGVPIEAIPAFFKENAIGYHLIKEVNWKEFPYLPLTLFAMVYSSDRIVLHFNVVEDDVRGFVTDDLGPVSSDSCVEFFACIGQEDFYYNIECNCLGYISMGWRKQRNDKEHAPAEALREIKRYTSLGTHHIGEIQKNTTWECVLDIPFTAFFRHNITNLKGTSVRANFYKCGGTGEYRHYVSWNPIVHEKPDFHRPECFGTIIFD